MEFADDNLKNWQAVDPVALFDAPVRKHIPDTKRNLKELLQTEARLSTDLVLWLDCDREGENIALEVVDCCKVVSPRLQVHRARFSAVTPRDIDRAMRNLGPPDSRLSWAVDARQEIDLRLGAVFTRFQTMFMRRHCPVVDQKVVSFGPCQFPTLGFVVERSWAVESFLPEEFWTIDLSITRDSKIAEFTWSRGRVFDRMICTVLAQILHEAQVTTVTGVVRKEKRKYCPYPLATIELQKRAVRFLRLSSDKTMDIAEKLYMKGLISYPRTETDSFPKDFDFMDLIRKQRGDPQWGQHAERLSGDQGMFTFPKIGHHDDKAHPPIHPTNYCSQFESREHQQVYELVVRHFLACCSGDAIADETIVTLDMGGENFTNSGSFSLVSFFSNSNPLIACRARYSRIQLLRGLSL